MSGGDWLVVGFVGVAVAERLWERRYARAATRGQVKMSWSYVAFHLLHALIYVGVLAEYFGRRQPLWWPVTAAGLLVSVLATVVRLAAIRALGRFWSLHLEIRADHQLIREGIYRRVRHPAYSAIMLEVISLPLVGNAWWTLLLAAGVYIPVLLLRWRREEVEMVAKFGDTYREYQRAVPAFVPRPGATAAR